MSKAGKKRNQARDAHREMNALGLLPNGAPIRVRIEEDGRKWITCTCGCKRQYPFSWVEELVPFFAQLVTEGMGRVVTTLTRAGYMPRATGSGGEGAFFQSCDGGALYLLNGEQCPTITRDARRWRRNDMDAFADLMVDAGAAAIALAGLEQEVF